VARGTMDELGLPETVVAIGEEYGLSQTNYDVQFDVPYKSRQTEFPKYDQVFWSTLANAADGSVIVVAASGMTDLAELLKPNTKGSIGNEELIRAKVINVSIMGGLIVGGQDEQIVPDAFGIAQADWAGTNNSHDWKATLVFRQRLQELGIPTVDVAKSTAYGSAVPRDVYDRFAETDHLVGIRLQSVQEALIQHLWRRCNLPADDKAGREGLIGVLNAAWFAKAFCGNNPAVLQLNGDDRVWNYYVLNFQLYDQLAVLASIPELAEIHFNPTNYTGPTGAIVKSIGTTGASGSRTNLKDPRQTAKALIDVMLAGLTL